MTTASDLGFDALTDDQLVEMARAIAVEVATRSPAVHDAARAAIEEAIAAARDSQDAEWARKKWIAEMVRAVVGERHTLNVWHSADGRTVRVYVDKPGDRKGRGASKSCLHVTGDSRTPPGTMDGDLEKRLRPLLAMVCRHAVEAFPGGLRLDCDVAAATDYATPAFAPDVQAEIDRLAAEEARQKARSAYEAEARRRIFADFEAALADEKARLGVTEMYQIDLKDKAAYARLVDLRDAAAAALKAEMAAYDEREGAI